MSWRDSKKPVRTAFNWMISADHILMVSLNSHEYSFGTVDFGLIMHIFLKAVMRGWVGEVGKGCDGEDRKVWVSHDNDKESLTPSLLLDKKTCQIFCFTVSPRDFV